MVGWGRLVNWSGMVDRGRVVYWGWFVCWCGMVDWSVSYGVTVSSRVTMFHCSMA